MRLALMFEWSFVRCRARPAFQRAPLLCHVEETSSTRSGQDVPSGDRQQLLVHDVGRGLHDDRVR
jgi:hypothetical protein